MFRSVTRFARANALELVLMAGAAAMIVCATLALCDALAFTDWPAPR